MPSAAADIHPRLAIIAGLISVWGARLSYNFWRKGGYAYSGEDYRWPVLRAGMSPLTFQVFNLVFISFIQNVLLATILSPVYVAWTASYSSRGALLTPLNAIDALATVLAAGWLVMEAVADQQQWNFQTAKHARINAGKRLTGPYAKGFITSGLWKYSRHPNFFAEQAFWWSLCLFATAATGRWVGWWLGGAVALSALFQGSTDFTEKISASKYPHYKEYQSSTSRLMPWFPAASAAAPSTPRGRKSPARPARTPTQEAEPKPGTPRAEAAEAAAVPEPAPAARRGRAATSSRKTSTSAASKSRSRSRSASDAAPAAKKAAAPKAPARSRSKSTSRAASSSKTKATASTVEAKPVRRATRARKA